MEIGNTAVQTLMAIDPAAAEFRHRIAEHVFLNSGQLSPPGHRPLDLRREMSVTRLP